MTGFVIFIHALICALLLLVILMQSGRGGGLTEGFASAESMFGTQTNQFLIRGTTVLAILYFVTCLSLAVLSSSKGKSIMPNQVATQAAPVVDPAEDVENTAVSTEIPAEADASAE